MIAMGKLLCADRFLYFSRTHAPRPLTSHDGPLKLRGLLYSVVDEGYFLCLMYEVPAAYFWIANAPVSRAARYAGRCTDHTHYHLYSVT
jgi:hypothetical protein